MQKLQETILYYHTGEEGSDRRVRLLKSVMVRLGIRIRNVGPDQVLEKVGYLAGMPGYDGREETKTEGADHAAEGSTLPVISEDVLVLRNFTSGRMDFLFYSMRKAGVPKMNLKAIVTEHNADWSFYHLYEELKEEHERLHPAEEAGE